MFLCSCCNTTYYEDIEKHLFSRYPLHLGLKPLTGKRIKNPQLFPINDHVLLKCHGGNYGDLLNLLNETDFFQLHLKESLLMKRDQAELRMFVTKVQAKMFVTKVQNIPSLIGREEHNIVSIVLSFLILYSLTKNDNIRFPWRKII